MIILEKNYDGYEAAASARVNQLLVKGIWIYFFLLILEGGLRKWFLPGFATPLLIIRDPLAIWLLIVAWRRNLLPANIYLLGMLVIGIIGLSITFLQGHGNIFVGLYGMRVFLIHFPLLFVIGQVFKREDVIKLGKVVLYLSIPMTILITLQFFSPQYAFINRGVAGDMAGAGFGGALGFFRPPGTFSFTNGTTLFYGLVSCYVFYFWLDSKNINKLLLLCATISLLIAIPLSISRALFFSVGVSIMFAIMAISRKPEYFGKMLLAGVGSLVALFFLSQTDMFQTATTVFTTRFETASDYRDHGLQGLLIDRYLGGLVGAIANSSEQPFFGHGLGMGSNVGSMLLTGERAFLISEGEWGKTVGELGPLLGLAVIMLRLGLSAEITIAAYRRLTEGDLLPWLLLGFALLNIPQGHWAQPTALGFFTLIGGLMLASLKNPEEETENL